MRGDNLVGIIFSNTSEKSVASLTQSRTMGAVPFAGKYKLIDFPLSNMSNSGISTVGVIVKDNYKTLMNHLGSGKPWNLSRINDGGLFVLPPRINGEEVPENKIDILSSIKDFMLESKENYVLLCDCNLVCNIDYSEILKSHIEKSADITIMCYKNTVFQKDPLCCTVLHLEDNGKVKNIQIDAPYDQRLPNSCIGSNAMIFNKNLLLDIIKKCKSQGFTNFKRDVLQSNVRKLNIYGYETSSFVYKISSMIEYFKCNMLIIDENIRSALFDPKRPIYTKTYNNAPAKYTKNCKVSNSLVSNGCVIDGDVNTCVLFEGVHIEKNSSISNAIIMGGTRIGYNCQISYAVVDEDVTINMGRKFMGFESYPVYISKSKII